MKSKMTKIAAAAAIIIAVIITFNLLDRPIDARQVFATAIDNVIEARTFFCKAISEHKKDGLLYVTEEVYMFKEPDLERIETRDYQAGVLQLEYIDIMDYNRRQHLHLRPDEKTARLYNRSIENMVDSQTGEMLFSRLDTSMREQLIERSKEAVEDLGTVELEGLTVRKLRSNVGDRIYTIWVDPLSELPIQIEITWPDRPNNRSMFSSIQIDAELDDDLFSLDPPEGYHLMEVVDQRTVYKQKLQVKMGSLLRACVMYQAQHNDQYPKELADLVTAGFYTEEALKRILAAPDNPDGPPIIRYRKPRVDADEDEIVLYEVYDQWPDDGLVVGYVNSSVSMFGPDDQQRFEELIK